jgi:uncharacterized membrane protein
MYFSNWKILLAIVIISLLLFPVITVTTGPLRIATGLLFVIFFPGYTLLSVLFPKRDDLGSVERLALSFGFSIAVVPLIGLILNYTRWGIRPYPIFISILLFIIVTSAIGCYRERKLSKTVRFGVTFKPSLPRWVGLTKMDKALSVSLVIAILAGFGSLGYVVAVPKPSEKFTQFYILNTEEKADDYPQQARLGEPVDVVIGIANHEYKPASYRVEIRIDDIKNGEIIVGPLAHEEKQEARVSFRPQIAGEKREVEFYLYKDSSHKPYFEDPLHLYIDVVTF